MKNTTLAELRKSSQDIRYVMVLEQMLHLSKRLEEEGREKLVWRESAEFWEAQAMYFKEQLLEVQNDAI